MITIPNPVSQPAVAGAPATTAIQAYSKKELCILYRVSHKVLTSWLGSLETELGKRHGRYYTTAQVSIIFKLLGEPPGIQPEMPPLFTPETPLSC